MSVHGEYGRALEVLLICVQRIDNAAARDWADGLANARAAQNPDLSTAARTCLRVLDAIDAEGVLSAPAGIGPDADALREPYQHLLAHCHAVLGSGS